MSRTPKALRRQYERGAIAVEAAIILPILLLFFGLPSLFYAFYFRQYTAVQKAAHDAAIYLSTASRLEMTTAGQDGNFAALTLAKSIVARELNGIVSDPTSIATGATCYYHVPVATKNSFCTPQTFKLDNYTLFKFDMTVGVPFVNPITGNEVDSMYMQTVVTVFYSAN